MYASGLADEKLVKEYCSQVLGWTVRDSTREENVFQDIDAWVNGKPVSIKAEHSGLKYGNIYFELAQHLTEFQDCQESARILDRKELTVSHVRDLVELGSWEYSWFYNSKANYYFILQGDILRIYSKADLQKHIQDIGFSHLRPLTQRRKDYQGGTFRYCNAICGFLPITAVRHQTLTNVRRDLTTRKS